MKYLRQALISLVILTLLTGVIYPLFIYGIGKVFFSNQANGSLIEKDGQIIGSSLIGQQFSQAKYFWSRPSAVEYNAAASGGSNKGPSNPDYLHSVQLRIDTLLHYNSDIELSDIPSDIVTASGSGLDPHISVQAAMIQVPRISKIRKVSPDILKKTIKDLTEKPMFGIFGTEKIHVLTLNLALDSISHF